jgi:chromate reductase, NAD(P)H dehydrogenase (quinone)
MNDGLIETANLRVLAIAGSLRANSFNLGLLRAAQEVALPEMTIEIYDIAAIPLFNQDLEAEGEPEPVAAFKAAIRRSHALLIATPEYNYGIPGVLKNAIDWASRPPGKSALADVPVAIMGATPGTGGTARAQLQLRHILAATKALVLVQQEIFVAGAMQKFDNEGRLTDEETRKYIRKLLEALAGWTRRLRAGSA